MAAANTSPPPANKNIKNIKNIWIVGARVSGEITFQCGQQSVRMGGPNEIPPDAVIMKQGSAANIPYTVPTREFAENMSEVDIVKLLDEI